MHEKQQEYYLEKANKNQSMTSPFSLLGPKNFHEFFFTATESCIWFIFR